MITIRALDEADAEHLVSAVHESVAEISPWMVWCTPDYARDHALTFIRAAMAGAAEGASYDFAIIDEAGVLCGVCGVNHVNRVDRFANLGYWIRTSRSRRGFAPAAALAVAEWTFTNTPLNRLEIVVAVHNVKSHRVAEKVGAVREGVLRNRLLVGGLPTDAVMYSLVRPART